MSAFRRMIPHLRPLRAPTTAATTHPWGLRPAAEPRAPRRPRGAGFTPCITAREPRPAENLRTPNVTFFWDYENCSLPSGDVSLTRLSALRELGRTYGDRVAFKTYLDRTAFLSSGGYALRAKLYANGVELIDCPHDGMKEVIDKAITVDMYEYALDNPPPSTLVLISGDRGYAPLVSRLALRGYNVVVVAPANSQWGLHSAQYTALHEWSDELCLVQVSNDMCGSLTSPESDARQEEEEDKNGSLPGEDTPQLDAFEPLVEVLKTKYHDKPYMPLSELGQLLPREALRSAGVTSVKKYTELARKLQVVQYKEKNGVFVTTGGYFWVSLHPRLRARGSATAAPEDSAEPEVDSAGPPADPAEASAEPVAPSPVSPPTRPVDVTASPVGVTGPFVEDAEIPVESTTAPTDVVTVSAEPAAMPVEPTTALVEPAAMSVEPTTSPVGLTTAATPMEPITPPVEPGTANSANQR